MKGEAMTLQEKYMIQKGKENRYSNKDIYDYYMNKRIEMREWYKVQEQVENAAAASIIQYIQDSLK